jgi:hypothetical protein
MFSQPSTRLHGVAVLWLLLAGGCVNLAPPWQNVKDAATQIGGSVGGFGYNGIEGYPGGGLAADGAPTGGAGGDDEAGAGGAGGGAQIDGDQNSNEAGATGGPLGADAALETGTALDTNGPPEAGNAIGTGGAVGTGGTLGAGGASSKGGNTAGGAGGSTAPPDAKPPVDQAPKNDTPSGPEVVAGLEAGVDAPVDAPAGPDLPTDPAAIVPTQGLIVYYPCEQASAGGTTLPDQSGNNHDATLTGATGFATGQVGDALVLTATNGVDGGASGGYATLPTGIVAGATDITVSAWFRITTTLSFQRVFDFGTSSATSSMYFMPRNVNGLPQFSIRLWPEAGAEIKQDLIATGTTIAVNTWHHVAVVLDAAGGHLYLDSVPVVNSTTMTLRPSDLGAMPNNWIGRSEFATDPYFDGMIDEFRIYTRALTAAEVALLFAAR